MRRRRYRRFSSKVPTREIARDDWTPLDVPAISEGVPFDDPDQYDDLIRTGLSDSRVPRPYRVPGVMRSPWAQVRASGRTVGLHREVARAARVDPFSRKLMAQLPQRALSCARRVIRREVLFALRKQGKGAGARRRRRDMNSKYRC